MPNPGTYYGTKPRGVVAKTKEGKPQLAVTFDVAHVAENGAWKPMGSAYERTVFMSFSDAAMPYTEDKLQKLGFNGDFDNPAFSVEGVSLECRHEQYNGRQTEKWDLSGGTFTPEKADDETIRHLNRLWKARQVGKAKAPAGNPSSPPPAAVETAAPSGDQIPF